MLLSCLWEADNQRSGVYSQRVINTGHLVEAEDGFYSIFLSSLWCGLGFKSLLSCPLLWSLTAHPPPLSLTSRPPAPQPSLREQLAHLFRFWCPLLSTEALVQALTKAPPTSYVNDFLFKARRLRVFQMCVTWTNRTKLGTRPSCWPLWPRSTRQRTCVPWRSSSAKAMSTPGPARSVTNGGKMPSLRFRL